jgi:hypothetical protein
VDVCWDHLLKRMVANPSFEQGIEAVMRRVLNAGRDEDVV